MLAAFLRYPSLSAKMLQVFNCREIHGGWYLVADMDIECYTPVHDTYTSLASLGVLLYPIGIPVSFLFLMLRCAPGPHACDSLTL